MIGKKIDYRFNAHETREAIILDKVMVEVGDMRTTTSVTKYLVIVKPYKKNCITTIRPSQIVDILNTQYV